MRRLQRRDDAFQPCQGQGGGECAVVVHRHHLRAAAGGQVRVHRPDARVIQSGGDRVRLGDLSVFRLHHQRPCAVDDAHSAQVDGGGRFAGVHALAAGFGQHNLHAPVVEVFVDGAGRVTPAAHAGEDIIGIVAPFLFVQLHFHLLADDRLQACHQVGVGVRANGRADDVVRIGRMPAPVADSLVGGVLQRAVAAAHRDDRCAEHLHFPDVQPLPLHVRFPHVDDTLHAGACANGSGSHAMLSGAGFGDDARLAHALREQQLPDGIVDFMRTGVIEVFALEENPAAVFLRQPLGEVEWGRPAGVVCEQRPELFLECRVVERCPVR